METPDLSPADKLTLLKRQRDLTRRKLELRRRNGLAFYKPHAKQDAFHRAGAVKYRYARTGNRWGKSEMGSAEDVAYAIGERPWYDKNDPARTAGIPRHPTKGVIIVVDWDKATEIFTNQDAFHQGKLWKYIPAELVTSKGIHRNSMGHIASITLTNGSSISIDTVKSFKNSGLGQESSSWDWIHIDEPCPKDMFVANARGLVDRHGSVWFTCTPLTEMWINDMFVPSARTVKKNSDLPHVAAANRWMITGAITDNPFNSQAAIDDFRSLLTHDEQQCRLLGKPLGMSGLIYKEFDYEQHVLQELPHDWSAYDRPPLYACCRYAIDPHPRTPHAVLFAATVPTGHTIFYKEIFDPCLLPELAKKIKLYTAGYYVHSGIVDPTVNTKNPIDGVTQMDTLLKCGLMLDTAPKDLDAGILEVRRQLAARDSNGRPWIYFSPELAETLYEFEHYMWNPDRADKPIDKDDHMMENLYRLCLRGLDYYDPVESVELPKLRDINQNLLKSDLTDSDTSADVSWRTEEIDQYFDALSNL